MLIQRSVRAPPGFLYSVRLVDPGVEIRSGRYRFATTFPPECRNRMLVVLEHPLPIIRLQGHHFDGLLHRKSGTLQRPRRRAAPSNYTLRGTSVETGKCLFLQRLIPHVTLGCTLIHLAPMSFEAGNGAPASTSPRCASVKPRDSCNRRRERQKFSSNLS